MGYSFFGTFAFGFYKSWLLPILEASGYHLLVIAS